MTPTPYDHRVVELAEWAVFIAAFINQWWVRLIFILIGVAGLVSFLRGRRK
jgi:hypothetical protein